MPVPLAAQLFEALAAHYRVDRELGRGGMATVWLARDLKHDRFVALKVLQPELAGTVGPDRFLREIRLTAQLQHPHILPVFDSGQTAGLLWYAMPYIDGESLRARLAHERQLPLREALNLAREAAEALDYAHAQGIVHRDIKPENILLSRGHALVADFGIAHAVSEAAGEALTKTGVTLGTPAYMSPEQAAGDLQIDGRSDVYSLGCTLYEMLAGEQPYAAPTAQAIVAKHLGAAIPSVRTVRPDIPEHVDAAIRRALAKTPASRFRTASELAVALAAPARVPWPRRPTIAALGAALVLAALSWGVLRDRGSRGVGAPNDMEPRSVAVLPFIDLSRTADSEYFSDGITEDLSSQLERIVELKVIAHTSAMQFRDRRESPATIGKALGVATLLYGTVRRAGDRVRVAARLVDARTGEQLWADEYDRELRDVFTIQREVAEQIAASLRATLSPADRARLERRPPADAEAYNLYLLGRHHFAQFTPAGWRRSIEYFEQAIAHDSGFAPAYVGLADAHVQLARLALARPRDAFPRARAAALKAIGLDSTLGEAHASLGLVAAAYDWDWNAAETRFRRALALSPSSADARMWYAAFVLTPLGRHDEAIAEMRRAEELDPVSLPVRQYVCWGFYFARRYDEAIAACRRALELDRHFPSAHAGLGFSYAALGRFDAALHDFRLAVADTTVTSDAVVGYAYALAGRESDARAVLRAVQERSRRHYVVPIDFSLLHAALGEHDDAFRWLRRAYEEHTTLLIYFNVAPWYDSLRDDPRFVSLMRNLGLTANPVPAPPPR